MAKKRLRLQEIPLEERRKALRDFDAIMSSRRKVRAYFDANVPSAVASRVRATLGWDVLCVQDHPKMTSQDDEFHYAASRKLNRLLFTLDKDFLNDHRFRLHESPGVFVLQARQDDPDDIYSAILVASRELTEAYRKVPEFYSRTKVFLTLEGRR